MFTKQHYEKLAGTVRSMPNHAATLRAQRESMANALADMLEKDNNRFKRDKFIQACGI